MLCSGCLSYQHPAAGPRQCAAGGMCSTKALLWGLGSTLQGVCPTKALQWGLGSVLQWVLVLPRPGDGGA